MSRLSTFGWDLLIVLNGAVVPSTYIVKNVAVEAQEDSSTIAEVTLRLPAGVVDLDAYRGQSITIDRISTTDIKRIFSGVVDIPVVDIPLETIKLQCTNKIEEIINLYPGSVSRTGYYSPAVFSIPKDTSEQLRQRMETIPASYHLDPLNSLYITSWEVKTIPDHVLDDADVFYMQPRVELASRGRLLNTVNIRFEYRYERAYHAEYTFRWHSPIIDDICVMLVDGVPLCQRALIQSAADATGLPIRGSISFTDIPAPGWYKCGFVSIAFSPIKINVATREKEDTFGAPVQDANGEDIVGTHQSERDENGNVVLESYISSMVDYRPVLCMGAEWSATRRWLQTLTEQYNITVTAPQSVAQYGTIDTEQSFGVTDRQTVDGWENYATYDFPAGAKVTTDEYVTYYIDNTIDRDLFNDAFTCAMHRAQTAILKTHRGNTVTFSTINNWAAVDLRHTVQLTCAPLACKGKVRRYRHTFDVEQGISRTEVELCLFKAQGSASTTPLAIPARPDTVVKIPNDLVILDNHYGEDPATTDSANWTGFIANKFIGGVKTTYPEAFIARAPELPNSQVRDSIIKETSATYNVEIPNDSLTITFDGKLYGE